MTTDSATTFGNRIDKTLKRRALPCATLLALGLAGSGLVSTASAQIAPGVPPLFGTVQLTTHFGATNVMGSAGGGIQLGQVDGSCRGWANAQPSHVLMSMTSFASLSISVTSSGDTTLLVQMPNGQILCNDDSNGFNPQIVTSVGPGPIRIWVGSYSGGTRHSYQMTVQNVGGPAAVPMPTGVDPRLPAVFGGTVLRAGFMPDPYVAAGSFGGPIEANNVDGNCRGWVTSAPSHQITTPTGFSRLRVMALSSADTTIMVQTPDGRRFCSDDSDGFNPLVEFATPPGRIHVWVGSYSSGRTGSYSLGVSELSHVVPTMLGAPSMPPPQVVVPPPPQVVVPPPPQVVVPQGGSNVQLQVGIPVTVIGPGLPPTTVALWSPVAGVRVELTLTQQRDGSMAVSARIGSSPVSMDASIPADLARDAVVTLTQMSSDRVLVRAEGAAQQLLYQLSWNGAVPVVARQWTGTLRQRVPRWAR